jgi:uncharacterized protein involved in outer membrane biogenesis
MKEPAPHHRDHHASSGHAHHDQHRHAAHHHAALHAHKTHKRHKRREFFRLLAGLALLCLTVFAIAGGVAYARFDAGSFKTRMATAIEAKTGRQIVLEGPLGLSFSWSRGLNLTVEDARILNPAWASRPDTARIGRLDFGIGLRALLEGKVEIVRFDLRDANILIETGPQGESNLDFTLPQETEDSNAAAALDAALGSDSLGLDRLRAVKIAILNGTLEIRQTDGSVQTFVAKEFRLSLTRAKTKLYFDGFYKGYPLILDAGGQPLMQLFGPVWFFTVDALFGGAHFRGVGDFKNGLHALDVSDLTVKAGKSELKAALSVIFGDQRPKVTGLIRGAYLDLAELALQAKGPETDDFLNPKPLPPKTYFSRASFDTEGLKAFDAHIDARIGAIPVGPSQIENLDARLILTDGVLLFSPLKFDVAGTQAIGLFKLDTRKPENEISVLLRARGADLSQLVHLGGFESVFTGRGDISLDIASEGSSPHDLAAHATGQIDLTAAAGAVSSQIIGNAGHALLDSLLPGSGWYMDSRMNCMAGHFALANGKLETRGLFIDMADVAVVGKGGADLGNETVDISFKPFAKGTDLSTLTPPVHIHGTLLQTQVDVDARASLDKAVSLFTGGNQAEAMPPDFTDVEGGGACALTQAKLSKAKFGAAGQIVEDVVQKMKGSFKSFGDRLEPSFGANPIQ